MATTREDCIAIEEAVRRNKVRYFIYLFCGKGGEMYLLSGTACVYLLFSCVDYSWLELQYDIRGFFLI